MRVVIRADASVQLGSGHVVRCLTLAHELERRGASVQFICRRHPGNLVERIEEAGFEVCSLPAGGPGAQEEALTTLDLLPRLKADWLVVDHYSIGAAWQRQVRGAVGTLMVIDDLADRDHDADLLLDQNLPDDDTRYAARAPAPCRRLLGPRYALLQPLYAQLRRQLPAAGGQVRRLLVFFGAHDATRSALKLAVVLGESDFAALAVDFVPGHDAALAAELRSAARAHAGWTVHDELPGLAGLLARADLAIGAGGTHSWERACLGVPALVAVIADNQSAPARALHALGAIRLAGDARAMSAQDWRESLRGLLADPGQVTAMARQARGVTDGHGAGRVALVLCGNAGLALRLRRATSHDEALLLAWANDPATRAVSFDKNPIAPADHHRWFAARLANEDCAILIGEDQHGLPLGQVRFDYVPERNETTVSISLDAAARGLGLGKRLLVAALEHSAATLAGSTTIAEVLDGNEASLALFRGAGFTEIAPRRAGSRAFSYPPDKHSGSRS